MSNRDATWLRTAERGVVRSAVGVGIATGAYGLSFGALSDASGLTLPQTCALSLLMFTGGSQFALIGILGGGGTAVAAVATAALLGARNALYGLRLAPLLRLRGVRRLVAAHLVIDESAAMAVGQLDVPKPPGGPGRPAGSRSVPAGAGEWDPVSSGDATLRLARVAFWSTGLSVFVLWNLATLLGALGARTIQDPATYGLDAAVPAAFLALLWPRLRDRRSWTVAAIAAAVALATAPFVPVGIPVLTAAVVVTLVVLRSPAPAPAGGS